MSGFQPKSKRAALSDGAMAPGLGFPGKKAAQAQVLNQAPDSIPGMFKPGEFVLPPDTVHAMGGKEALNQVVQATHTPAPSSAMVPRGFKPEVFFANGGAPEDERQRMQNQSAMYVRGAQEAAANRPAAPPAAPTTAPAPAQPSEYGRQMREVGGALADGASWLGKTIVSAPGYGFNSRGAPAAPATAADPAAQNPTDQRLAAGTQQAPATTPAPAPLAAPAPAPAATTQPPSNMIAPGVYKNAPGQYSDNASGMGMPAGFTGQPNAQNMAAADALAGRSQQESMNRVTARGMGSLAQSVSAPTVPHSGNSWQARNDLRNAEVSAKSITQTDRWGKGGDRTATQTYLAALQADAAARGAQPGLDAAAMRENAGIQREGIQQNGATTRTGMTEQGANTRAGARNALEGEELGLKREAAGFTARAAAQAEQLRNTLLDPKATPEQKRQAQQNRQELSGKTDQWKAVALQGGTDAQGNKTESILGAVNERTGEMRRMDGGQGGGAQPSANHLAALKANPKQAAQFDEVYGPGAAARALKGG